MSLDEVAAIYLPLSRLLNLYIEASQALRRATATFLGSERPRVPFVIGARGQRRRGQEHDGARAAGAAVALAQPPAGGPGHDRRVPAAAAGAGSRAGSWTARAFRRATTCKRLVQFMADVKAGVPEVTAPVYSHLRLRRRGRPASGRAQARHRDRRGAERAADGRGARRAAAIAGFVSDFFDFSIYIDARGAGHRAVVRRAVPHAARHGLHRSVLVLPPLRVAVDARGDRDRARHLAVGERGEPAGERAAVTRRART